MMTNRATMSEQYTPTTEEVRELIAEAREQAAYLRGVSRDGSMPYSGELLVSLADALEYVRAERDAEFIATFNPEMVLALLDRVEKAEGELDLMEQALDLSKMVEDKIKKKLDRAEQALQRVREQHQVDEYTAGHTIVRCVCEEMWPCSTIKALEGDE